ncbi:hypothetical protein N657DRAFT_491173 [Parathielavia appendiculata]|uniref:Uncharacterized protein n=1 Tax=Parathielavia appendiculata TaxID=2587402 RepID=A0AAN6TWP3_9PEZI|nr:hypothetical protein N657DRAFT_491173 [Parathielavia appendiculata]
MPMTTTMVTDAPKLLMEYDPLHRRLLVAQNELGFKKKHAKAICSMAESSKANSRGRKGNGRRHSGEKGLGFKSVFALASTVWIRSGYYSFRFNRDEPLGRVRPTWIDDFPVRIVDVFTAILLEIESDSKDGNVIDGTKPSSVP